MTTILRIIPAANTCLYLPVYLAVNWRLFEKFASTDEYDVRLEEPDIQGDRWAIEQLPQNDDPVLAVCDPMEVVNVGSLRDLTGMRILGSFIKKPCFWAINQCEQLAHLDDVEHFLGVVRSNDHMQTGHYFGGFFHDKIEAKWGTKVPRTNAPFGQEIARLLEFADHGKGYCGVTADLLGCEVASRMGLAKVFYSFTQDSQFDDFVTTGFVVRAAALAKHREFLTHFMSAVSLACGIIDAAPESIAPIIAQLSQKPDYQRQSFVGSAQAQAHWQNEGVRNDVIQRVWQRLVNEEVYDPQIAISEDAWKNALKYRSIAQSKRDAAAQLYSVIVDKELAEEATGRADNLLTRGRMKQLVDSIQQIKTTVDGVQQRVATLEKPGGHSEQSALTALTPSFFELAAVLFISLASGMTIFGYLLQHIGARNWSSLFGITFVSAMGGLTVCWISWKGKSWLQARKAVGILKTIRDFVVNGPTGWVVIGSVSLGLAPTLVPLAYFYYFDPGNMQETAIVTAGTMVSTLLFIIIHQLDIVKIWWEKDGKS